MTQPTSRTSWARSIAIVLVVCFAMAGSALLASTHAIHTSYVQARHAIAHANKVAKARELHAIKVDDQVSRAEMLHAIQVSDQRWCSALTILYSAAAQHPPTTSTGRKLFNDFHKIAHQYKCPGAKGPGRGKG